MEDLTREEKAAAAMALRREADRLETMKRDYTAARGRTSNAAVKSMAEEGMVNVTERITALRALAAKLHPAQAQR